MPVTICPYCSRPTLGNPNLMKCPNCGAERPARVVALDIEGGTALEQGRLRDAIDNDMNEGTMEAYAKAQFAWVAEGRWRVVSVSPDAPPFGALGPLKPTLSSDQLRRKVEMALVHGNLRFE